MNFINKIILLTFIIINIISYVFINEITWLLLIKQTTQYISLSILNIFFIKLKITLFISILIILIIKIKLYNKILNNLTYKTEKYILNNYIKIILIQILIINIIINIWILPYIWYFFNLTEEINKTLIILILPDYTVSLKIITQIYISFNLIIIIQIILLLTTNSKYQYIIIINIILNLLLLPPIPILQIIIIYLNILKTIFNNFKIKQFKLIKQLY